MYYEEAIIDGVLSYRSSPRGEWTPFSPMALTARLQQMQQACGLTGWRESVGVDG